MSRTITQLSDTLLAFPSPDEALTDPNGLLAIGGDLNPDRLLMAYQSGIFPWFSEHDPILWWSPDPRAVLYPERFHISRSLRKFCQRSQYHVTLNTAFTAVIHACAENRAEGTWITPEIMEAYTHLHDLGYAHSVEVWEDSVLIGGLYGIAQGALFCGESMFSRKENASKIALMSFCQHFIQYGGKLIDCQILNPHTASLGAGEIPRQDYLQQLSQLRLVNIQNTCWQQRELSVFN